MHPEKKQKPKTIGILGGMGPAASASFYVLLNTTAQQDYHAEQDTDFPPLFIYNMPLEGFDETASFDKADHIREQLIAGVQKLESAGSNFIVIPCNSVHYFLEDMQKAVSIPILSILDTTAKAVQRLAYKKVGLLTSDSSRKYELYQKVLEKRGVASLTTTDAEQEEITRVILHVMAGTQGKEDIARLRMIIGRLVSDGADAIVLGCTELPLALTQENVEIPLFSSTSLLAEEALRESFGISHVKKAD